VPDIAVPSGTNTGWNLRRPGFAEGELLLLGAYFPFAATRKERLDARDPRPSLEERYPTDDYYLRAIAQAAEALRTQRLLLTEDVDRTVKAVAARQQKTP
jgi:Alpha/beta hydrolase domain